MAGLGAVADLVQFCLQGSNCVLTWRETKYYSRAGKQITVTSLAGRWLYLSHVQMEFEEKKLAVFLLHGPDALVWAVYVCPSDYLPACLLVCHFFYLSVYLFFCLAAACLLPNISACLFLYCGRCFNAAGLYIRNCKVDESVCTVTLALCHRLSFDAKHCRRGLECLLEISMVSW